MGKCNFCKTNIKADPGKHGTAGIGRHFKRCPLGPYKQQTKLNFRKNGSGDEEKGKSSLWKFDKEAAREAICHMIIVDELPFSFVENEGFKYLMSVVCPQLIVPTRKTIVKDVLKKCSEKKKDIKTLVKKPGQRVSITTDTWTSIQRLNYISLTAHWVDESWTLNKQSLNFIPILSHKGEDIERSIEKCVKDWGIENVFTVTVDNASANDTAVTWLKRRLNLWGTNVLDGKYLHRRCVAHIINLIVQDGLKEKSEASVIKSIRGAVQYVRGSPSRYQNFLNFVAKDRVSKKMLCLDVLTRWNSTYLMLDAAIPLQGAFALYGGEYVNYSRTFSKERGGDGVPTDADWKRAEMFLQFLRPFYEITLCISGNKYVTSNIVYQDISHLDMLLSRYMDSNDTEVSVMALKMRLKFDKYWGGNEEVNKIVYYAVILDPRLKMEYMNFSFDRIHGENSERSDGLKKIVKNGMIELFNFYKSKHIQNLDTQNLSSSTFCAASSSSNVTPLNHGDFQGFSLTNDFFMERSRISGQEKSELDRYLAEDIEEPTLGGLSILICWKQNAHRWPILSKMARDVLAIPVTTVASESAFSTGGRILDCFRSSLLPNTVEALICGQDWFRDKKKEAKPGVEEDIVEVEILEKELSTITTIGRRQSTPNKLDG